MQTGTFSNGEFYGHRINVQGRHCSAWYAADGTLKDAEFRIAAGAHLRRRPVKRGGPIWRSLQRQAETVRAAAQAGAA